MTGWQQASNEAGTGSDTPGSDLHWRLRQLHQAHGTALYGFLESWTHGDRQVTENLVRETLVRASNNLDQLGADTATLRPWLFTLARRVAITFNQVNRREATRTAAREAATAFHIGAETGREPGDQAIALAIMRISPEHRRVAVEMFHRGRSVQQTARALGVPEAVVKIRALGALRALRSAIDDLMAAKSG